MTRDLAPSKPAAQANQAAKSIAFVFVFLL